MGREISLFTLINPFAMKRPEANSISREQKHRGCTSQLTTNQNYLIPAVEAAVVQWNTG